MLFSGKEWVLLESWLIVIVIDDRMRLNHWEILFVTFKKELHYNILHDVYTFLHIAIISTEQKPHHTVLNVKIV